jgi:uncharacterized membrane protein
MEVVLFSTDDFSFLFSKLLYLLVGSHLLHSSDHKKNKRNLKHAWTLAGIIAFLIGITLIVMVTLAYRKKLGKQSENLMISKSQIFTFYLNSIQIVLQT